MTMMSRAFAFAAALVGLGLCLVSCQKAPSPGTGGPGDASGPEGEPPMAGRVELVEFLNTWNPACRMQAPATAEVAKKYGEQVKVTRVDVEKDKVAAERYGADAKPPAFVILVDGKVARRLEGLQSAEELSAALDAALGRTPAKSPAGE